MEFFEKLGETITEAGKDVTQKVTDLTEITKIKMDIRSKEESVRRNYAEIGRQYYELHKDDEEPLFEEVALITEALQKIEELRGEIAGRKGKKICPSCGAPNDIDALFCNKCGAKCENADTEETAAEEAEFVEVEEDVEIKEDTEAEDKEA